MATVQDILNAAYGYSLKNQPGAIATESTELVGVVNRSQRKYFGGGARVNPWFFAESNAVSFASGGWARPVAAESVFRIEDGSNVEVIVVPVTDRAAETTKPALYRLGQIYYGAGNPGDPTAGDLTFFYAKRSTDLTATTSVLDPLWPEAYNELLILEVALYLAFKDGRDEEYAAYLNGLQEWQQIYLQFLQHETTNERRRYGELKRFNTAEIFPVPSRIRGAA